MMFRTVVKGFLITILAILAFLPSILILIGFAQNLWEDWRDKKAGRPTKDELRKNLEDSWENAQAMEKDLAKEKEELAQWEKAVSEREKAVKATECIHRETERAFMQLSAAVEKGPNETTQRERDNALCELAREYEPLVLSGKCSIRDIPPCLKVTPKYGGELITYSLRAARGISKERFKETIEYLEVLAEVLRVESSVDASYIQRLERLAMDYKMQLDWQ